MTSVTKMNSDFDRILDLCIDRINRGDSIEACLKDYPGLEKELSPLLRSMFQTRNVYNFKVSDDSKRVARQRLNAALDRPERVSFFTRLARPALMAAIVGVIVVLLAGYFALRATAFPAQPPTVTVSSPSPTGNFAFLVSDAPNDIGDFNNLKVTVYKIGLLQSGSSAKWVEFVPETAEFDLVQLPGDKTQELWRGNIPEGSYSKAVIYVPSVQGALKATGETISIKLPSDKLQLEESFQVSAGTVTSFVYDITVIKTGNEENAKYILKPQAGSSGASQQPAPATIPADKGNGRDNNNGKGPK